MRKVLVTLILGFIGYVALTRGRSIIYFQFTLVEMLIGMAVLLTVLWAIFKK